MKINRNFLLLTQGVIVSGMGMSLFNIICILWLVEVVGLGSLVGLLILITGVPLAVMNLFGGVIADRFNRRDMIVLADFINALIVLGLSLSLFLIDNTYLQVLSLFLAHVAMSIIFGVSAPAYVSILPDLMSKQSLPLGNVILSTGLLASQFLGRAIGGVLFALLGMPVLLLITSASLFVSAILERLIRIPSGGMIDVAVSDSNANNKKDAVAELKQGFEYVLNNKSLIHVIAMRLGCHWCLGCLWVTLPFLVNLQYQEGVEWFGYLAAALAVGIAVGSMYGGAKFNQLNGIGSRTLLFGLSMLIGPIMCIGLSLGSSVYIALLLVFMVGVFAQGLPETLVTTQLQLTAPSHLRGRIMSINMMSGSFSLVGAFAAGILVDILDNNIVLVQVILSAVACLAMLAIWCQNVWPLFIGQVADTEVAK